MPPKKKRRRRKYFTTSESPQEGLQKKARPGLGSKKAPGSRNLSSTSKRTCATGWRKKPCYLAMYVAEKLETFDKQKTMIAENQIQNLLFGLEIEEEHSSQDPSVPCHSQTSTHNRNQGSISCMRMLQSHSPSQFH